MDWDLLERLTMAPGPSGHEGRVRDVVANEIADVVEEISVDPVGNLVARRPGPGPRVVLAAHMDELGFIVSHIEDEGFLRVLTVGGHDPRALAAAKVVVHGRGDLPGVIGGKPVHLMERSEREKAPKEKDLYVDVGLDAERVRELVRPGDPVTRAANITRLGDLVSGPGLDDRAGLYVMLEAVRTLAEHRCDLHAVATVQEEVGLRGARVAASRIRPELALAIDVTLANDGPGVPARERVTEVGKGAAIKVMDSSVIVPTAMVDSLIGLAEAEGISHQLEVMPRGGTDTRELALAGDGARAGGVSIPLRYTHQITEAAHPDDLDACVALVRAFCEGAHELAF
jgi:endoglucanase